MQIVDVNIIKINYKISSLLGSANSISTAFVSVLSTICSKSIPHIIIISFLSIYGL